MRTVFLIGAFIIISIGKEVFAQQPNVANQIQIHWMPSSTYDGASNLDLKLVVKNTSDRNLDLSKWRLWFNAMYPVVDKKTASYSYINHKGNLYSLDFAGQTLKPNDSLVTLYGTRYAISNISTVPNGFYFQDKNDYKNYQAVNNVVYTPIKLSADKQNDFNANLFDKNQKLNIKTEVPLVFPTPRSLKVTSGSYKVPTVLNCFVSADIHVNFELLKTVPAVQDLMLISSDEKSAQFVIKRVEGLKDEAYKLLVTADGIRIESATDAGVQYALQSLVSMLSPEMYLGKSAIEIPCVTIEDEPRYSYRGFMMDIARNFKDKSTIFKYLYRR